jgi:RNA polymerase sigma factor (sigma-70 family)
LLSTQDVLVNLDPGNLALVPSSQAVASEPAGALSADGLQALAGRLVCGEAEALADILRVVGAKVAAGLMRRHPLLSPEDIEDVLSIASQRLWESRTQYDAARGSLAAWFFIIADNAAKDLAKKEARRLEKPAELRDFPTPKPLAPNEPSQDSAAHQDLHDILGALPALDHRIIWAYAEAGGTGAWAADLSRELGIRPGTLRVRCRRIKERIKKAMHARVAT